MAFGLPDRVLSIVPSDARGAGGGWVTRVSEKRAHSRKREAEKLLQAKKRRVSWV